jgi:phage shock protein C
VIPDGHLAPEKGIISVMNDGMHGKQLVRSREGRIVAGVCAGLAVYFGLDANIVRLIFAGLTAFAGVGVLLYVVAWLIVPEEGEPSSIAENLINKNKT